MTGRDAAVTPARGRLQRQSEGMLSQSLSFAKLTFDAGTRQPRDVLVLLPSRPATNRLVSRTRVRSPSITAGMPLTDAPWFT